MPDPPISSEWAKRMWPGRSGVGKQERPPGAQDDEDAGGDEGDAGTSAGGAEEPGIEAGDIDQAATKLEKEEVEQVGEGFAGIEGFDEGQYEDSCDEVGDEEAEAEKGRCATIVRA